MPVPERASRLPLLTLGLGIAAAATGLALAASSAKAHGDAAWIQAGRYTDRNDVHCCGENDCWAAMPGDIERIVVDGQGGWLHRATGTRLMDGDKGIHPSERGVLFFCARGGELKCVFPAIAT